MCRIVEVLEGVIEHAFGLERREERLCHGIVVAVTHRTDGLADVISLTDGLEGAGGVLCALV